mmetsp:Transcript_23273/g.72765  ORF Transcript_23273/g.72765 Transcript_23273/m.72765 type:complete len:82 (-) Transcript_23273:25-270(-)
MASEISPVWRDAAYVRNGIVSSKLPQKSGKTLTRKATKRLFKKIDKDGRGAITGRDLRDVFTGATLNAGEAGAVLELMVRN